MDRPGLRSPGESGRPRVVEVALEVPGRALREVALVAGRGEVERSRCGHGVDGLRDDAVLEDRLVEVEDVVDDDVAVVRRVAERLDVRREARFADVRRREEELRVGRDVVDDLEHRAALVRPAGEVLHDGHGREVPERIARSGQVAARDVRGRAAERVERVGEDADPDAGAGVPERVAGVVGAMRAVALGGHRSDERLPQRLGDARPHARRARVERAAARGDPRRFGVERLDGGLDERHVRKAGDGLDLREVDSRPHASKAPGGVEDLAAERLDSHREPVDRRRRPRGDVHVDPAVRVRPDVCRRERDSGRHRLTARLAHRLQELRVDLLLRRRARALLREESLDLLESQVGHSIRADGKVEEHEAGEGGDSCARSQQTDEDPEERIERHGTSRG